jgi:putative transposase
LAYRQEVWLAAQSAGATGLAASVGYVHLSSLLPGLKQENPWLADAPHHALQATLRDLDGAFTAFFNKKSAFPRFHRKGDRDSLRFPDPKQIEVDGEWAKLPKLGWVRLRLSRPIQGEIRNATVSREGTAWFVSFCVRGKFTLPNAGQAGIGLDVGVVQSVTTSEGEVIAFPVPTAKEEQRLRRLQRRVSRRRKGSHRRSCAVHAVARLRRHLAARRRDAAHKASTRLAITHKSIALEDLSVRALTASAAGTVDQPGRNVRGKAALNRKLLANAHGDFRRMLAYKCERSGAQLILVNPAFTSQTCQVCQHCSPENRQNQAVFLCTACGFTANADWNAAVNILAAGQAVTAQGGVGTAPADELRTQPRVWWLIGPGSTGIPAKAAHAA